MKELLKALGNEQKALEEYLDSSLEEKGLREIVDPSGYIYSVSQVEPTLGLDGEAFWPYVEDLGLEWSEVYKMEVDNQKVANLVTAGVIPGDILPKFTKTVRKGYKSHNVRKAQEHELAIAQENPGDGDSSHLPELRTL